jgi:hypothetical protein
MHHKHAALPSPRGIEQTTERRAFCVTIQQYHMPT